MTGGLFTAWIGAQGPFGQGIPGSYVLGLCFGRQLHGFHVVIVLWLGGILTPGERHSYSRPRLKTFKV